jgi:hypothetical protein
MTGSPTCVRGPLIALATVIALAITTTAASAATTRAEYVAQVDPICQVEQAQEKAVLGPATRRVRRLEDRGLDPLKPAKPIARIIVHGYDRLAAIQRDADSRIASIPPAPGDEAVVSSWLQQRATFTELFQRSAHVLAHGHRRLFFRLLFKALGVQQTAEESIQDFGFGSCVQIVPGFEGD